MRVCACVSAGCAMHMMRCQASAARRPFARLSVTPDRLLSLVRCPCRSVLEMLAGFNADLALRNAEGHTPAEVPCLHAQPTQPNGSPRRTKYELIGLS